MLAELSTTEELLGFSIDNVLLLWVTTGVRPSARCFGCSVATRFSSCNQNGASSFSCSFWLFCYLYNFRNYGRRTAYCTNPFYF